MQIAYESRKSRIGLYFLIERTLTLKGHSQEQFSGERENQVGAIYNHLASSGLPSDTWFFITSIFVGMDPEFRPPSSLYSDEPFELEELLPSLPMPTTLDEELSVRTLCEDIKNLEAELDRLQRNWLLTYQTLEISEEVANQIEFICKNAKDRMTMERNKWLANCTAF